MARKPAALLGILALIVAALGAGPLLWPRAPEWTEAEKETLRGLWIGSLGPLPADPSNAVADDPRAAALGQHLFFDRRFSSTGQVACATCHQPERGFVDGLPLSKGVGTTNRKAMTIVGTAYSPWLFWDGRKDSLWAQALGPLENPAEHGGTRLQYAHLIFDQYRAEYEAIFGPLPDLADQTRFPDAAGPVPDPVARAAWEGLSPDDREAVTRIYTNLGKAIAAYERQVQPGASRFDTYVEALMTNDRPASERTLTSDEVAGLRLFIGRGNCTNCHNGPLFTNNEFHNTGVPERPELPQDLGRAIGAQQVLSDEFNCLSRYSDAGPGDCSELRFLKVDDHRLERAFRPPTLRNVAETAPYMHAGQFATLAEVLDHYSRAPAAPAGHSELTPLNLTEQEKQHLEAFLRSLSGPLAVPPSPLTRVTERSE
ncbi:MAG TPA: cytochrome c peroxidase [Dehalococcoidia bacterium]|nr:cytochrome c peroxidase [Dehalococcoidia bacterium]